MVPIESVRQKLPTQLYHNYATQYFIMLHADSLCILHVDMTVSYIFHLTHLNSEEINKRANIIHNIIILSDHLLFVMKEQHTLFVGSKQQVILPFPYISILFGLHQLHFSFNQVSKLKIVFQIAQLIIIIRAQTNRAQQFKYRYGRKVSVFLCSYRTR